jgi:Type VI secretion system/phage-baseplate injector OB domain
MIQNSSGSSRHFGKYRGKVTDNKDPLMQGRIRAKVPVVFGNNETGWALPSAPYAGSGVGIFFIPPINANVWIEFEEGNPDIPIWSGCFWGIGEAPKMPAIPEIKVIKTDFATITMNDLAGAGGISIETTNGLKIVMSITGIELLNGAAKIKLTPAGVSINDGALEVI